MVLNHDDAQFSELAAIAPSHVISYGLGLGSDVRPTAFKLGWSGIDATFQTPDGAFDVHSSLMGKPNLYNISAAIGIGVGLGIYTDSIRAGIEQLPVVPGRFENIPTTQDFRVVVDYAHTDDALEKVLQTAREITPAPGRVIVVFGCAGERDRTKRPLMGNAAGRLSDLAVLTSDNPRGEDPMAIIREVELGLREIAGANYRSIADRREAIRFALSAASTGDTLILAGKGHETYQVIGNQTFDFDDRIVVRELLDELAAGRNQ
jgi:UDP-N-acetylmuramoyl-L-alanyl-D-glutamate--2,6-diaminopimelate ligase